MNTSSPAPIALSTRRGGRLSSIRAREGGFTLVELLTAMTIAAVLLAGAIPLTSSLVDSIRMRMVANALLSHMAMARSEAIKRNDRVVMCKSDGRSGCAATGGWEQGWIMFHDANNNGLLDEGEAILNHMPALPARFRLIGNATVSRYVSYAPNGTTKMVSGAFQAGTFTLCRESTSRGSARIVVINSAGRPRTREATVDSCY